VATYFLCADIRSIGYNGTDEDFCRRLTTEVGVAAIPVSAFYDRAPPTDYIRFAFCKEDATLQEALRRLREGLRKL
jgi:aspartate/methionine/tyrosine aminotransferase